MVQGAIHELQHQKGGRRGYLLKVTGERGLSEKDDAIYDDIIHEMPLLKRFVTIHNISMFETSFSFYLQHLGPDSFVCFKNGKTGDHELCSCCAHHVRRELWCSNMS